MSKERANGPCIRKQSPAKPGREPQLRDLITRLPFDQPGSGTARVVTIIGVTKDLSQMGMHLRSILQRHHLVVSLSTAIFADAEEDDPVDLVPFLLVLVAGGVRDPAYSRELLCRLAKPATACPLSHHGNVGSDASLHEAWQD